MDIFSHSRLLQSTLSGLQSNFKNRARTAVACLVIRAIALQPSIHPAIPAAFLVLLELWPLFCCSKTDLWSTLQMENIMSEHVLQPHNSKQ
jgi:hypothetical protein